MYNYAVMHKNKANYDVPVYCRHSEPEFISSQFEFVIFSLHEESLK